MKKGILIGCLIPFVLLFLLGGCAVILFTGDSTSEGGKIVEGEKQSSTGKEEVVVAKVGETLELDGVQFLVKGFEYTNVFGTNEFLQEKASEGAVLLVLDVSVTNNSSEEINTDSSFFKVIDDTGAEFESMTVLGEDTLLFESINPRLSRSGKVVFEVPIDLKGRLDVQVQTGFWGTVKGKINLQ